jgi:hypothetical protein
LDDRINALEALESTAENGAVLAACVLEHGSVAEVLVLQPSIRGGLGDVVALHARLLAPTHISTHLQFADTMPELGAALEGFGAVNGDEVDLAQCTVAGEGLGLRGALMVNAEVAFSVDVVDGNGAAVPNPTALVRAMLVRKGGGGAAAAASSPPPTITVATVEEGRCVCTYTAPATVGAWSLEVQVGSEHLGGSPFAVEVVSLFQFSGIKIEQDNLSSAALVQSGWALSYQHLYTHRDTSSAELDGVGGTKWLVAARRTGEDALVVAAMGDRDAVLKRSTEPKVAHEHNGAHWYHFEESSFGFAPEAKVDADGDGVDGRDSTSPHRLSWFVEANYGGGYRAGSNDELWLSTDWQMLIFTA